jgi:hypothetical protein
MQCAGQLGCRESAKGVDAGHHPQIKAVTVVVLAAGSTGIGLQRLDRFVSQHGALGQNAVRREEGQPDKRGAAGIAPEA